jgi:hypothetical protein
MSQDPLFAMPTLAELPVVLAGPIVRKVMVEDQKDELGQVIEEASVSVWLAMKENRRVCLKLYDRDSQIDHFVSECAEPVQIGDHIYAILVTIPLSKITTNTDKIEYGMRYFYELVFGEVGSATLPYNSSTDLWTQGIVSNSSDWATRRATLLIGSHTKLFFETPAFRKDQFYVSHASCRKPHGGHYKEEKDALELLFHEMKAIEEAPVLGKPKFPQQLFLTGDQIYADDVDCGLFGMIQKMIPVLYNSSYDPEKYFSGSISSDEFKMGYRMETVNTYGGFEQEAPYGQNHLLHEAEFYLMYLFVWSDVLWPETLPTFTELYSNADVDLYADKFEFTKVIVAGEFLGYWIANGTARDFFESIEDLNKNGYYFLSNTELYKVKEDFLFKRDHIDSFRQGLPKVRKVFAHVPTYMMFDDHDVTDDWFINKEWSQKVLGDSTNPNNIQLGRELGRYIISNGLMAYSIFQGWGNKPSDFESIKNATGATISKGVIEKIGDWYEQIVDVINHDYTSGFETLRFPLKDDLIPTIEADSDFTYANSNGLRLNSAINWNYQFDCGLYKVVIIDTRTKRGFVPHKDVPACLICSNHIGEQIPIVDSYDSNEFTLLISPAPAMGIEGIESIQEKITSTGYFWGHLKKTIAGADAESWFSQPIAWDALFYGLINAKQLVVLSGDVHYGFAQQTMMWDHTDVPVSLPYGNKWKRTPLPPALVQTKKLDIVQFVSSSAKNSTAFPGELTATRIAHVSDFFRSNAIDIVIPDNRTTIKRVIREEIEILSNNTHNQISYSEKFENWTGARIDIQKNNHFTEAEVARGSQYFSRVRRRYDLQPARQYAIRSLRDDSATKPYRRLVGMNNVGLIQFEGGEPTQELIYYHDKKVDLTQKLTTKYVANPNLIFMPY